MKTKEVLFNFPNENEICIVKDSDHEKNIVKSTK